MRGEERRGGERRTEETEGGEERKRKRILALPQTPYCLSTVFLEYYFILFIPLGSAVLELKLKALIMDIIHNVDVVDFLHETSQVLRHPQPACHG
jgi:hypothetical protein